MLSDEDLSIEEKLLSEQAENSKKYDRNTGYLSDKLITVADLPSKDCAYINLMKKSNKFWLFKVPADFDISLLHQQKIQIDGQVAVEKESKGVSYEVKSKRLLNKEMDNLNVFLPLKDTKLKTVGTIDNYVSVMKKINVPPSVIPYEDVCNSVEISSPEKLKNRNTFNDPDISEELDESNIKKEKKHKSPKRDRKDFMPENFQNMPDVKMTLQVYEISNHFDGTIECKKELEESDRSNDQQIVIKEEMPCEYSTSTSPKKKKRKSK